MADAELSLLYHGLLLPKETHSQESLDYMQKLTFKDDDVVGVTYPKSGKITINREVLLLMLTMERDLLHNVNFGVCARKSVSLRKENGLSQSMRRLNDA